jgi:iron(III) transport system permease protein
VSANLTTKFLFQAFSQAANEALMRGLGYAASTGFSQRGRRFAAGLQIGSHGEILSPIVTAIALGSVAIPGIVLGFGYISLCNRMPISKDTVFPRQEFTAG